jgi:hypothetical protein
VEQLTELSALYVPNEHRTLQDSVTDDANVEAWKRLPKPKQIFSAHLSMYKR